MCEYIYACISNIPAQFNRVDILVVHPQIVIQITNHKCHAKLCNVAHLCISCCPVGSWPTCRSLCIRRRSVRYACKSHIVSDTLDEDNKNHNMR